MSVKLSDIRMFKKIISRKSVEDFSWVIIDPVRLCQKNLHTFLDKATSWCLDVIFHEDASRARKDNSPLNMHIFRKTALSLINQAKTGRISKKKLMFRASLNPELLLNILFQSKK